MQNFEKKNQAIVDGFRRQLRETPELREGRLKLSWSNWTFGLESLADSAERLRNNQIEWIELHGNRYGQDLGYRAPEVNSILADHNVKVAGICGMFGPENDLSSPSGVARQNAVDYIRRQLELCVEVGGSYILVVPGAVGRPVAYDASEFHRSVETLQIVADEFSQAGVQAAIEPIRSAEVSFIHTLADAEEYIQAVDSPGVQHINGDVYHMQVEESHIADSIVQYGERLANLHLADSNRCALGDGSMDLDQIIMALYTIGYTVGRKFVTPEPLGPGGNPYPAMFGTTSPELLDRLVAQTATYFRQREDAVLQTLSA